MPPAISSLLTAAKTAVAKGDLATALTKLIAAWEKQPADALANVIDRVGERAAAAHPPLTAKTTKLRNEKWNELAKEGDPAVRGMLLATLTETKGSGETLDRVNLLAAHADPRLAAKIGDLLEKPNYNASVSRTRPYWKRLWELLPTVGDARLLARAKQWRGAWAANTSLNPAERDELALRYGKVEAALVDAYGGGGAVLAKVDAALMEEIGKALGAAPPPPAHAGTDEELLAEIFAHHEDDAPRAVFADQLQERGDPRGEFIALQLARARGEAGNPKREKELVDEHWKAFAGSLATKLRKGDMEFERGFVSSGTCTEFVDPDPAWQTLVQIERGLPQPEATYPALRRLALLTNDHVIALAKRTKPLAVEHLSWDGPKVDYGANGKVAIKAFRRMKCLPALKSLELRGEDGWVQAGFDEAFGPDELTWAWDSKPTAKLEELTTAAGLENLAAWHGTLSKTELRTVTLVGSSGAGFPTAWRLTFTRGGDGSLSKLALASPRRAPEGAMKQVFGDRLLIGLEKLPKTALESVVVDLPPSTWKAVPAFKKALKTVLARQTRLRESSGLPSR